MTESVITALIGAAGLILAGVLTTLVERARRSAVGAADAATAALAEVRPNGGSSAHDTIIRRITSVTEEIGELRRELRERDHDQARALRDHVSDFHLPHPNGRRP